MDDDTPSPAPPNADPSTEQREDQRRAYRTSETPPELVAEFLPLLERLARGEGYDDPEEDTAAQPDAPVR